MIIVIKIFMNLFLFSGLKFVDSRHGLITNWEHFYNILISYPNELDCIDIGIIVAGVLIILAIFCGQNAPHSHMFFFKMVLY